MTTPNTEHAAHIATAAGIALEWVNILRSTADDEHLPEGFSALVADTYYDDLARLQTVDAISAAAFLVNQFAHWNYLDDDDWESFHSHIMDCLSDFEATTDE